MRALLAGLGSWLNCFVRSQNTGIPVAGGRFSPVAAAPAGEAWLRWVRSRQTPTLIYYSRLAPAVLRRVGTGRRIFNGQRQKKARSNSPRVRGDGRPQLHAAAKEWRRKAEGKKVFTSPSQAHTPQRKEEISRSHRLIATFGKHLFPWACVRLEHPCVRLEHHGFSGGLASTIRTSATLVPLGPVRINPPTALRSG